MVANTPPPSARRSLRPLLGPAACLLAGALAWAACGGAGDGSASGASGGGGSDGAGGDGPPDVVELFGEAYADLPPTAKVQTFTGLKLDAERERHASDGGGRARLVSGPAEVVVSSRHTWELEYEAGPLGIAEGGMLYFLTSPFWGWDDRPQTRYADSPGYTEVSTEAEGVELEPVELDTNMLGIRIGGRELAEGERVRIVYGAGDAGARADEYGEEGSTFWLAVDGDGDGVRALIEECPTIDVLPGPPSGLWMTVPSSLAVGEEARVALALLDRRGSAFGDWTGDVVFVDVPEGLVVPERVTIGEGDEGIGSAVVRAEAEGLFRLEARLEPKLPGAPDDFTYESNPMLVDDEPIRVLWADLHGHSQVSDGTGTPTDYFRYARDVAALDVAALTDHDHWGVRFLDQDPETWAHIQEVTRDFHEPGRFVTLLGYEWTSWLYGHRHVLYFADEGELHSSIDPEKETPAELWAALEGAPVMTFAHHSAGGPVATDWSYEPPPELEPVTEVVSVHGVSEARDSPGSIYRPVEGNFVRDVIEDRGYRFGFIGSGDSHDGHPGLAHLASPSGGLAAILAEERTREAVREALLERRCYATNGERILLRTSLGGHRMGSTIPAEEAGTLELRVHVIGTGPIETVEVVRSGEIVAVECDGREEVLLPPLATDLSSGDYVYVRVRQENGGLAWSSPFYVD